MNGVWLCALCLWDLFFSTRSYQVQPKIVTSSFFTPTAISHER